MRRVVLAVLLASCALLGAAPAHAADDPNVAPASSSSADGRVVTGAGRSLGVSAVHELHPDGETLTVDGSGYDTSKGIYVAFCVIPPANALPTPCGGGQDRQGSTGESNWISNEPGNENLKKPYGDGGTFRVTLSVNALLNENVDCRSARCAVVTRNDHTRGSDRSQDLFVPITFRATAATGGGTKTTTTLSPVTLPPTTSTTLPAIFAPPTAAVTADGLSISGGGKTLSSSDVKNLGDDTVTVRGAGFDPAKGVYVALCAVPDVATSAPGPCASGSSGASAWISSNPPDYGKALATPYRDGGSFTAAIEVNPVIDTDHDCRNIDCAITTRNDDTNATDRSQDLLLPVTFRATNTSTSTATAPTITDTRSFSLEPLGIAVITVLLGAAGTGFVLYRRRSRA